MRFRYVLLVCVFPAVAAAQVPDAQARKDALKWALAQQDPETGAFKVEPKGKPSAIRDCLLAVFPAIPYCVDLIEGPYLTTNENVVKAFRPKK